MIPTLHVRLLGSFHLRLDDAPVTTIDHPRLQALLAYLVLHRSVPHPRQHLAFLLWPDSTETQARTNLRTLLHRLRQALPHADDFLHIDAQTVQWRTDVPWRLDIADFDQRLAQVEAAERVGDQPMIRTALRAAVEIYQGDLLPGWYDDWVLLERERLHQVFLAALERLVVLLEQAGDYVAAIGYAQRLLRHDPLHEAAYRHLMRLHALSGDRASALRVYQTCTTLLERELGVEPSPATRELYERLLRPELWPAPAPERPPSTGRAAPQHNLPLALTSFIGRERELREVERLLGTTRLLTLMGAGGCGKTRLALAVATELVTAYRDGVWFVELATLTDADLVPQAVAAALGVREETQRPLTTTLIEALRSRELLLVLDNCEHLLDACAQLAVLLLGGSPHVRLLATSRAALNIAGETTWLVPSLALPDRVSSESQLPPLTELRAVGSVQLFVERAAAVLPTFALTAGNAGAVAQICRRLDGIPLAIELAAARVKVLTADQLAARLDDCMRLLTGGSRTALPRQQTLRAAIDWSYDLLSKREQALFRRLSVFVGGWTLEAAEAVCGNAGSGNEARSSRHPTADIQSGDVLELLAQLVDQSLVLVDRSTDGAARYRLLEPLRQYAAAKLDAAQEAELLRQRHAHYFLALAEQAEPELTTGAQPAWLKRLEREHDNLRAALAWSLDSGSERELAASVPNEPLPPQTPIAPPAEVGLRLASALWWFWSVSGYVREGRAWLEQAIGNVRLPMQDTATTNQSQAHYRQAQIAIRATALYRAGFLLNWQGDCAQATTLCEESLALFQELGDRRGIAWARYTLAGIAMMQGEFERAGPLYAESLPLFRELRDVRGIGWTLNDLGIWAMMRSNHTQAASYYTEALELFREIGNLRDTANCLSNLACSAHYSGDSGKAAGYYAEALALYRDLENKRGIAGTLIGLGSIVHCSGDIERAVGYYAEALALERALENKGRMATALINLAYVSQRQGYLEQALAYCVESLTLSRELKLQQPLVECVAAIAGLAGALGRAECAARLLAAVETLMAGMSAVWWPSDRLEFDRNVTIVRALLDPATFEAAWAAGQTLTLEQAVVEALRVVEPPIPHPTSDDRLPDA